MWEVNGRRDYRSISSRCLSHWPIQKRLKRDAQATNRTLLIERLMVTNSSNASWTLSQWILWENFSAAGRIPVDQQWRVKAQRDQWTINWRSRDNSANDNLFLGKRTAFRVAGIQPWDRFTCKYLQIFGTFLDSLELIRSPSLNCMEFQRVPWIRSSVEDHPGRVHQSTPAYLAR